MYGGEDLAKKGVVFVNFNYRVGALGFLAHPELTAELPHHASGDYGFLDQVAGLQWMKLPPVSLDSYLSERRPG